MRLIHTADWHLGHHLHGLSRAREHAAFLAWLLDTLAAVEADALLIAGDIFDTANPSAEAQRQWFDFLGRLRRRLPSLDVVVIAGNHDSPARLVAPAPVLGPLGVHVVGVVRRDGDRIDAAGLVVPLRDRAGQVCAQVAAVPYLRLPDLPPVEVEEGRDPVIEGVRVLYEQVVAAALLAAEPGQALIGMGHCYMTDTTLSELSERRILGGNLHALPVEVFPESVAYVALGHLHKAQTVGGERVRYSGSPIPLSMTEAPYTHQVLQVDLQGPGLAAVTPLPVPRTVDLVRIPPGSDHLPVEEALAAVDALPERGEEDEPLDWPFLEVKVQLSGPRPDLRRELEERLETRAARLVRVASQGSGHGQPLAEVIRTTGLEGLDPGEVFARRWAREHADPVPEALLASFHELVDAAHRGLS